MELLAAILCHLNVVELRNLGATCRLLQKASSAEAVMPDVQQAVARNTQGLVRRRIAAGFVCQQTQPTPAEVVFSPCGQLLAWKETQTIMVRHRHSGLSVTSVMRECEASGSLVWSHDSGCLAMFYRKPGRLMYEGCPLVLDVASCSTTHISVGQSTPCCGPRLLWAPSRRVMVMDQCRLASTRYDEAQWRIYLVELSGRMTTVAQQHEPTAVAPCWAANNTALALDSGRRFVVYDVATQQSCIAVPSPSAIMAWSPASWDPPRLLFVTSCRCSVLPATAHFLDVRGKSMGPGQTALFKSNRITALVWGEHGVAAVDRECVWLCAVGGSSTQLVLEVRHKVLVSGLERPVLSPDHAHLCLCRPLFHAPELIDLVLVNLLAGAQGSGCLLELPKLPGTPRCSWTRQGYALVVVPPTPDHGRGCYKVFNFVYDPRALFVGQTSPALRHRGGVQRFGHAEGR